MATTLLTVAPFRADQVAQERLGLDLDERRNGATGARARRLAAASGRALVDVLVFVAVGAFLFLAVGPHLLGYRTVTMLTGSMAPGIEPGDVVVDTPLPVEDVEPGMVITYAIPVGDHRIVSHRVVTVDQAADGSVTVQTKGDANDGLDPWQATLDGDTAWQVRAVVPHVGTVIAALRHPALSAALVWAVPAVLVGWVLWGIWRPTGDEPPGQAADDGADGTDADAVTDRASVQVSS